MSDHNARIRRRFDSWQDALNDSDVGADECNRKRAMFYDELSSAYREGLLIAPTPAALAASTEVQAMLAEERAKVWKAVRTAVQLYIDKRSPPQDDEDECQIDVLEQVVATINRAEAAALRGETK